MRVRAQNARRILDLAQEYKVPIEMPVIFSHPHGISTGRGNPRHELDIAPPAMNYASLSPSSEETAADSLRLEAVTARVHFVDLLDCALSANHPHVDTMIVVTSHDDKATHAVARKHGAICMQTDLFHKNGRHFNKGAALNAGLARCQCGRASCLCSNWLLSALARKRRQELPALAWERGAAPDNELQFTFKAEIEVFHLLMLFFSGTARFSSSVFDARRFDTLPCG